MGLNPEAIFTAISTTAATSGFAVMLLLGMDVASVAAASWPLAPPSYALSGGTAAAGNGRSDLMRYLARRSTAAATRGKAQTGTTRQLLNEFLTAQRFGRRRFYCQSNNRRFDANHRL